jgi:acyl-CoA synthetase (AMP-forming)/AMP-acid ligase II
MTIGAKLVFNRARFDAEEVLQLIQDEKISIWGAIPTMLHRVVHHPKVRDYDLSTLRGSRSAARPTPPETIERAREVLPDSAELRQRVRLTETHGVALGERGKDCSSARPSIGGRCRSST